MRSASVSREGRALALWLLAGALLLGLHATALFATPSYCSNCSCSGIGGCTGCQTAIAQGGVPYYVNIPTFPTYNFCDPSPQGQGCTTGNLVCWSSGNTGQTMTYSDAGCTMQAGMVDNPLVVIKSGCEPGEE